MKTLSATLWHGLNILIYLFRFYKIKFGIFILHSDRATREKDGELNACAGKNETGP